VSVADVSPGGAGEAEDGVAVDAERAPGRAYAVAFGQVVQDRRGGGLGEVVAVQRRALAPGEAGAAGIAVELPVLLVLAEAAADGQVAGAAPAVERASGLLAAESGEVVPGRAEPDGRRDAIEGWES
jgi:hypothetical protein